MNDQLGPLARLCASPHSFSRKTKQSFMRHHMNLTYRVRGKGNKAKRRQGLQVIDSTYSPHWPHAMNAFEKSQLIKQS